MQRVYPQVISWKCSYYLRLRDLAEFNVDKDVGLLLVIWLVGLSLPLVGCLAVRMPTFKPMNP